MFSEFKPSLQAISIQSKTALTQINFYAHFEQIVSLNLHYCIKILIYIYYSILCFTSGTYLYMISKF
jgi:hypothetical protein